MWAWASLIVVISNRKIALVVVVVVVMVVVMVVVRDYTTLSSIPLSHDRAADRKGKE